MKKKYRVVLSPEERAQLSCLIRTGKVAAYRRIHAELLLLIDEGPDGGCLRDKAAGAHVGVNERTVSRLRARCVEQGLEAALERKKHSQSRPRRLDGEGEAQLVALLCGEAPKGQAKWTLTLLGNRLVALGIVDSIADETVRQVLKKRHQTLA